MYIGTILIKLKIKFCNHFNNSSPYYKTHGSSVYEASYSRQSILASKNNDTQPLNQLSAQ